MPDAVIDIGIPVRGIVGSILNFEVPRRSSSFLVEVQTVPLRPCGCRGGIVYLPQDGGPLTRPRRLDGPDPGRDGEILAGCHVEGTGVIHGDVIVPVEILGPSDYSLCG